MLCKTNGFRPAGGPVVQANGFRLGGRTCCASQWISSRREDLLCKTMDFVSEGGPVVQDKWISSRRDEMFIDGKFKTFALR
jgi:hypothetical protein